MKSLNIMQSLGLILVLLLIILGVRQCAIMDSDLIDTNFIDHTEVVNGDQLYIYTTDGTRLGVQLVDEQDTYEIVYKEQKYAVIFLNSCVAGVDKPGLYIAQQCTHYVLFDGRNYVAPDVDL